MTDSVKESTWLLTEHLRYTPLSLVDDIINSINALLYRAVSAVEAGLLNAPPASLGFKIPQSKPNRKNSRKHPNPSKSTDPDGASNEQEESASNELEDDNDDDDNNKGGWPPQAKLEIENGVHQLETLFESTVDKDFDKLEIYVLRNVLTVADDVVNWIRLGHYQNLDLAPNPSAPTATLDSLRVLRAKLHETQKLHRALVHESRRNAALITQLNALLAPPPLTTNGGTISAVSGSGGLSTTDNGDGTRSSPSLGFLTSHPLAQSLSIGSSSVSGQQQQPLTTSTEFVTTQLDSLRALLGELRPKVASLARGDASMSVKDERQEEGARNEQKRAEYIESQTRRHLMDTRGLELDDKGAVRDGQWQGGGRRIREEEVKQLEEMVEMVEVLKKAADAAGRSSTREEEDPS